MFNDLVFRFHWMRPIVLGALILVGALAIAAPMASAQEGPVSICAKAWAAPANSGFNCGEPQPPAAITYDFGDLPETYGTLLPTARAMASKIATVMVSPIAREARRRYGWAPRWISHRTGKAMASLRSTRMATIPIPTILSPATL